MLVIVVVACLIGSAAYYAALWWLFEPDRKIGLSDPSWRDPLGFPLGRIRHPWSEITCALAARRTALRKRPDGSGVVADRTLHAAAQRHIPYQGSRWSDHRERIFPAALLLAPVGEDHL